MTIQAAKELFYRNGYSNVTVAEIARATNVSPSAIFRHFGTKSELLVESIRYGLRTFDDVFISIKAEGEFGPGTLQSVLRRLAELAIVQRDLGVLWQREARSLDEIDQRRLRMELRQTTKTLARFVRLDRPDLSDDVADFLSWCVMSALVSISFHSLELPRDEFVSLLVEMTKKLIGIEVIENPEMHHDAGLSLVHENSRKDLVISEAVELFADRGYGSVGVDDIGKAVGIAGPSIYSHFASKLEILLAALERGNVLLRSEADIALSSNDGPEKKLMRLVNSYAHLAVHDRFLMRIVLSEVNQLDPVNRELARQKQRDYIQRWTELLCAFSEEETTLARIRVQAVLLVVCDVVQTPHLRTLPGLEQYLRQVGGAILGISMEE